MIHSGHATSANNSQVHSAHYNISLLTIATCDSTIHNFMSTMQKYQRHFWMMSIDFSA